MNHLMIDEIEHELRSRGMLRKVAELDKVVDQRNAEIVRLNRKLAAAEELLDGQFAEDLHRQTGISIERCRELLEVIRED